MLSPLILLLLPQNLAPTPIRKGSPRLSHHDISIDRCILVRSAVSSVDEPVLFLLTPASARRRTLASW